MRPKWGSPVDFSRTLLTHRLRGPKYGKSLRRNIVLLQAIAGLGYDFRQVLAYCSKYNIGRHSPGR
jgi:hypothetical protein